MKKFLVSLLFSLVAHMSYSQQVYLLAVGISDYPGLNNDLKLPVNDAISITELYEMNNAATTKLLLNKQATCSAIKRESMNLFSQVGPEDIIVFFFSGHGCPGGFVAYDEFLDYKVLKDIFSSSQARSKMIFADACFSGRLRDTKTTQSQGYQDIDVMLFLSSRHNEVSIETPTMYNGFFTACLVKCLKGGADVNGDRAITAKELFNAVSRGVKELSYDKQHPVMWGNFDDNMIVMTWK